MSDERNELQTNDDERLSRLSASVPTESPERAGDDVVAEYEMRYRPERKPKAAPRSYSTLNVSQEERTWAALAHAGIWVTALAGIFTAGIVVPLVMFLPLGVYLMYRNRSDFVAFHALQAFVIQLIATAGATVLAIVGAIVFPVGFVIGAVLTVVLVGVVLLILLAILTPLYFLGVALLPLAAVVIGTIAAIQTYHGHDYRYPYIADWVDRQMAGGFLNA